MYPRACENHTTWVWKFKPIGDAYFVVAPDGRYLTGENKDWGIVTVKKDVNTAWKIKDVGDGYYLFQMKNTNQCLNLSHEKFDTYTCKDTDRQQRFKFIS